MTRDSNTAIPFQCHQCGECCSSWNIPVEAEKAQQLLKLAWVQQRLAETRRELVPVAEAMYRIPLTDENVCVFLAPDRRCMIEAQEGPSLKPHECKRFPFASIELPDKRIHHEASAACKHISEMLIQAFQPIIPQERRQKTIDSLAQSLAPEESEAFEKLPDRIRLNLWRTSPWEDYLALQATWRDCLRDDTLSPEVALHRIQASLSSTASKALHPSHQSKRMPNWLNQLLLLRFLRKPYRTLSTWQLLRGKHYHDPRLFGALIELTRLQAIHWPSQHNRLINAFLYQLLCRKRILVEGGSVESLLAMGWVAVCLIRWYAKALASLQESDVITEKEVSTAIRLVERYYTGHQPRFFAWFQSPLQSGILLRTIQPLLHAPRLTRFQPAP